MGGAGVRVVLGVLCVCLGLLYIGVLKLLWVAGRGGCFLRCGLGFSCLCGWLLFGYLSVC